MPIKLQTNEWETYYPLYEELLVKLNTLQWFSVKGWEGSLFKTQEKCGFIIEKTAWKSHYIYFVSWIGEHEISAKNTKVALCMDFESSIRKKFAKKFVEDVTNIFPDSSYKISSKNRYILFKKIRPLDKTVLLKTLESEFSNIQKIGELIDTTIKSIICNE